MQGLYDELLYSEARLKSLEKKIQLLCRQNEACQRLIRIPGIGELTSTAMVAAVPNASEFKNGRHMSAWLGLVPRQYSSGDKQILLGISKRGDRYLRTRDVFETRLALVPSVIKLAVDRADSADIVRLETHLEKEHEAHDSDNRHEAIRLSGTFHILLAEIANNEVMLRTIKELVARSSLIISAFGAPSVSSCRDDVHTELLGAFRKRNKDLAASLMHAHLNKILEHVHLHAPKNKQVDFVSLL